MILYFFATGNRPQGGGRVEDELDVAAQGAAPFAQKEGDPVWVPLCAGAL